MIPVSAGFNPYADTRRCDIHISFEMVDIDAAETAVPTVTDACPLTQLAQTHDRTEQMSRKLASLERDYWLLDGTYFLPAEDELPVLQTGWWSGEISDGAGVFETVPAISFFWEVPQSSVGLTLFFDSAAGQYPSRFAVCAYSREGLLLKSITVENHAQSCEVDFPCEDYSCLRIEFLRTDKPYRRVRLAEVVFGLVKRFDKSSVTEAVLENSFSPKAESLPSGELTLTIDNSDSAWNMANPKGVYAYLQQTMPLDVSFTLDGVSVFMGRYYFTKASAEDDSMTAKMIANDKLYWLDSVKYRGGSSGVWTLTQAVSAVLAASGIEFAVCVPDGLGSREVRRTLPQDCSCREALRLLAQAAQCTCRMDRNGILTFFDPLDRNPPVCELTHSRMHEVPKITVGEEINTVELVVRDGYTEGAADEIWTASDRNAGDSVLLAEYENAVVEDGQETADWLLLLEKKRLLYQVTERGNPALETADTILIHDGYGGSRAAVITGQSFHFDGGLSCDLEVMG